MVTITNNDALSTLVIQATDSEGIPTDGPLVIGPEQAATITVNSSNKLVLSVALPPVDQGNT